MSHIHEHKARGCAAPKCWVFISGYNPNWHDRTDLLCAPRWLYSLESRLALTNWMELATCLDVSFFFTCRVWGYASCLAKLTCLGVREEWKQLISSSLPENIQIWRASTPAALAQCHDLLGNTHLRTFLCLTLPPGHVLSARTLTLQTEGFII